MFISNTEALSAYELQLFEKMAQAIYQASNCEDNKMSMIRIKGEAYAIVECKDGSIVGCPQVHYENFIDKYHPRPIGMIPAIQIIMQRTIKNDGSKLSLSEAKGYYCQMQEKGEDALNIFLTFLKVLG